MDTAVGQEARRIRSAPGTPSVRDVACGICGDATRRAGGPSHPRLREMDAANPADLRGEGVRRETLKGESRRERSQYARIRETLPKPEVPMAQDARKPIFHLKAVDKSPGGHALNVEDCRQSLKNWPGRSRPRRSARPAGQQRMYDATE